MDYLNGILLATKILQISSVMIEILEVIVRL